MLNLKPAIVRLFLFMKQIHLFFSNTGEYTPVIIPYTAKNKFYLLPELDCKNSMPFNSNRFLYPEMSVLGIDEIKRLSTNYSVSSTRQRILFQADHSFEEYRQKFDIIQKHLQRGDIYEVNFCIEFYAENVIINPYATYLNVLERLHQPFSAFVRWGDWFLITASPERFLQKTGNKIISQPIKGTAPRGKNAKEDQWLKENLKNSVKDISENIMIVDLVRNDLSKIAKRDSVKVSGLCEVYTFESVHQMISTVEAELKDDICFDHIIEATFPMGSMTGAPKFSAMKIIDNLEKSSRGLFSGSVGYLDQNGNFDLNVVIRAIQYNAITGYLSVWAGGAITVHTTAEKEWEECHIKANSVIQILNGIIDGR
ncbi:MAG: hypothetical protein KatS3mg034_1086 [Vicingaceae bacterium]|nr:MAG: hypothetical protein KatS3mg034_1086 [Vicingaceae bacterium]